MIRAPLVKSWLEKSLLLAKKNRLDLSNLQGQAYDGAGNMAGSVNSTAAPIVAQYPLALYTFTVCCLICSDFNIKLEQCNSKERTVLHDLMFNLPYLRMSLSLNKDHLLHCIFLLTK